MSEQIVNPSSVGRMSKQFYLITLIGGGILLIIFSILAATADEDLLAVSIVISVAITVIVLRFWYQAWSAIQDGQARTTPGKAVGFLFIPLFGLYWLFQMTWGFAKDFNSYVSRHGLGVGPLPEGMFLALPILGLMNLIPVVGYITSLAGAVLYIIVIIKVCDAVNAFGEDEPSGTGA